MSTTTSSQSGLSNCSLFTKEVSKSNTTSNSRLDNILMQLESSTWISKFVRNNLYQELFATLEEEENVDIKISEKVLAVCVHDLKKDFQYTTPILCVISSILKKLKTGKYLPLPDLRVSAESVFDLVKVIGTMTNVDALMTMCSKTLFLYPDDILAAVVTSYSPQVIKIIDSSCSLCIQNKEAEIQFVARVLKIWPNESKDAFVKENLAFWFSKIIPNILTMIRKKCCALEHIEVLELLTDSLVHIDYAENPHWKLLLECIYNPEKYPAVMKALLENNNSYWHRIWIVFIRLLKNQITKVNNSAGSPINAMLPVVEQAFKMDPLNRCRAFLCWNVLIDNFSLELNEVYVIKRLKLLIIPLRSSNAKVEATALAKLNTWWHLMRQFHSKIESFSDMILIPFLHFCFGKPNSKIRIVPPGQFSDELKKQSLQALVEIVGHVNCGGCVELPKLKNNLISTKILINYWNDWIHGLKTAISTSASIMSTSNSESVTQQISCLWKSFLKIISELPDNNIRKDLFNDLLAVLEVLLEEVSKDIEHMTNLADIIFNVLIKSLLADEKVIQLLKTKQQKGPIHKILLTIASPLIDSYYKRKDTKEIVSKLKPVSNLILDVTLSCPDSITGWMFNSLPTNDSTLMLWTALAEIVCEVKYEMTKTNLNTMLLWPLQSITSFSCITSIVGYNWFTLYNLVRLKLSETSLDNDVYNTLSVLPEMAPSQFNLILWVCLAVLKQKLISGNGAERENLAEILWKTLIKVNEYQNIENVFPVLIDTLVLMLNKVADTVHLKLAEHTIGIVKLVLNLFKSVLKPKDGFNINFPTNFFEVLVKSLLGIFEIKPYAQLKFKIVEELVECVPFATVFTKKNVILFLQSYLTDSNKEDNALYYKIKALADTLDVDRDIDTNGKPVNQATDNNKFTTPIVKEISKKPKKKEASIVNTVVENGEEFVVVKSNWKFNPRKLTENQKEKLKRKREDIPALYQDLSQSQDEFKLSTWKTDSQDTSTSSKSNSKSTNEDIAVILTKIPSTNIVPKIMDNILSDNNDKKDDNNVNIQQPSISKSPRLALKDRVFRNVRNLIEKSGIQNEDKVKMDDLNQTVNENINKTPSSKTLIISNLINSAPPKITSERPSRVIKKPKKFDDSELISSRRKRRSQTDSQPDPDNISLPLEQMMESTVSDKDAQGSLSCKSSKEPVLNIDETNAIVSTSNSNNEICEEVSDETTKDRTELTKTIDKIDTAEISKDEMHVDTNAIEISTSCQTKETDCSVPEQVSKELLTPKLTKKDLEEDKSLVKKKRSRIEKQLLIDTVEGHPLLQPKSERRATRKTISNAESYFRRKSLLEKMDKVKPGSKSAMKDDKKSKDKEKSFDKLRSSSISVVESQDTMPDTSDELPQSEDIIESSQDSTITTISVKSTKQALKKIPVVKLDSNIVEEFKSKDLNKPIDTQNLTDKFDNDIISLSDIKSSNDQETKEDIELSKNKTIEEEKIQTSLFENIETQPTEDLKNSDDVIIVNDEDGPIIVNSDTTCIGTDTQEIAEADTQPSDYESIPQSMIHNNEADCLTVQKVDEIQNSDSNIIYVSGNTQDETTKTISISLEVTSTENTESGACSPLKDETQRQRDFLNDTIEISPIKTLSPLRETQSPSPKTSNDYVVIKLTSPVQSNGEPFEKCDSPEIFTEEKVSPDKRDQSPPRVEVIVNTTSPSSSLSLKKNRPQVRSIGRAAQMLGLCAPDKLQAIMNSDRSSETEEAKKNNPSNTPARRNLRILYNSAIDNNDNAEQSEDSENFLKFKRSLPTTDCSPSGPILKRKLDIVDDVTISPASKRKRVSFHDPPVSTTVAVQKYIEPTGVRSPQSTAIKRHERQMRIHSNLKSPKRLDNVFKLDTALTKTVESFNEDVNVICIDDTEMSSIEQTPAVELVKTSDLNDTDPIYPDLLDCKDPIDNIAGELSSPAMKTLFIKELQGKVETVADLAKMTELEVNRLCIKAPKVNVVKKVLTDYASRRGKTVSDNVNIVEPNLEAKMAEPVTLKIDVEVQTNEILSKNSSMQTIAPPVTTVHTQSDFVPTLSTGAQTDESGSKSTKDIVETCLAERTDFVEQLCMQLKEPLIQQIAEKLSFNASSNVLTKQMTTSNSVEVLNRILEHQSTLVSPNEQSGQNKLSILQNYMCNRFDSKELILFCSKLLQKIHDNPT